MRLPHAAPVSWPNALPCNVFPACSWIAGATEVDVSAARKAILIKVPYRLLKAYHKVQQRLVRELEKKFSGEMI